MDDIILSTNPEEHSTRLRKILDKLQEEGMTLNLDKCIFHATRLEYLGQIVGSDGIRKDPKKVEAVKNYPQPSDVTELRRFLGMANQLTKFTPLLAELTEPLRQLLKKNTAWVWGPDQEKAFNKIKDELMSDRILAMYDPNLETVLSVDSSSYGIGGVILQTQTSGDLLPIAYASRSMTPTERRYTHIEKEALRLYRHSEQMSH